MPSEIKLDRESRKLLLIRVKTLIELANKNLKKSRNMKKSSQKLSEFII